MTPIKPGYNPKVDPMKVITGRCRAAFVKVFQPRPSMSNKDKMEYSLMLLIPKSDQETLAALKAALNAAKEKKFGSGKIRGLKQPIKDADDPENGFAPEEGDNDEAAIERYNTVYKGHYFVNVKSNYKPAVVRPEDSNVEINSPEEFKSGDYCRCSLRAYGYEVKDNDGAATAKGVNLGLNNIQKLETGESLSGVTKASDEFGAVTGIVSGSSDDDDDDDDDIAF